MASLKMKVRNYTQNLGMSENEALWKVLQEAQDQISDMDQKLADCIENMNHHAAEKVFGPISD